MPERRKCYIPEVYGSTVIGVEGTEDVLAEVVSVSTTYKSNIQFPDENHKSNLGKIFEYMATNFSLLSSPPGQSFRNPSYHS